MKLQLLFSNLPFLFFTLLFVDAALGQAPQKMSYQAIIRNADDELIRNESIGMRILILEDSEFGSAVYVETQVVTTNANGLVSIIIGDGDVVQGDLSNIEWGQKPHFIKSEIDPNGGENYTLVGTSELLSVPYALYAASGGEPGLPEGSELGNTTFWDGTQWVVDNSNLYHDSQRIGIGIDNPLALLHTHGLEVAGGNVVFEGEYKTQNPGPAPVEGNGTRMMWYPDKSAFRAGTVSGNEWDTDNIGSASNAWGQDTEASGFRSTAWGTITEASGSASTAWGAITEASGSGSTAWGLNTVASGFSSTAWGEATIASGTGSVAMGIGTLAKSGYEVALGRYNTDYSPSSTEGWNLDDRLLIIGNGSSSSNRNDALTLLKNGNLGLNMPEPEHRLAVAVSTNSTPDGDGIAVVNTGTGNYWNIHMSNSWLRFSANNDNVAYIEATTGAYIETSDRTLKENITPVQEGLLEKVNQINVVNYNYKRDPSKRMTTGVIAQELEPLFPQFVHSEGEDSKLGVNYSGLSVIAIQAIQEQQQMINRQEQEMLRQKQRLQQQEEENSNQKRQLENMQNQLDQLKAMLEQKNQE